MFLCSPNNPTGWPLERELVKEALERCRACGARLVLDECFIDFLEDPGQYEARDLIREYPELLVVKAFTKSFAMPGLRLGYALCGDPEVPGADAGDAPALECVPARPGRRRGGPSGGRRISGGIPESGGPGKGVSPGRPGGLRVSLSMVPEQTMYFSKEGRGFTGRPWRQDS